MEVLIHNRLDDIRLEKDCKRKRGPELAKKIFTRLDQIKAAPTLIDLKGAPGNCHELAGNRKGQLAISLIGQYRLIFSPTAPAESIYEGNCLVWQKVTSVQIEEIVDYHG